MANFVSIIAKQNRVKLGALLKNINVGFPPALRDKRDSLRLGHTLNTVSKKKTFYTPAM